MADYFTDVVRPQNPEDLAEAMGWASARGQTIELGGNFSKRRMGGPAKPANITISTAAMNRVRQYEPRDLTISVEAGITYCELSRLLAEHHQMIPLDPPFSDIATIGGVVASNCCGPRRRLYGTARDLVIGMQFALLDGKLVKSGGMVVKNVAGLDMGKLMIGSFGTLAAIAVVNFKVIPQPPCERSFRFSFAGLDEALGVRDAILKSPLDPTAIDLLNPAATESAKPAYLLAVRAGGNTAAIARYERELAAMGALPMRPGEDAGFWSTLQNFTPLYLDLHPDGAVVRVSCTLKGLAAVMRPITGPAVARAGSGVCHVYFEHADDAVHYAAGMVREHSETVIEFAPEGRKEALDLWPAPGQDLEIMKRIKRMFDPQLILNRGRLYGVI
ncbi:MAG TPA: FAD-binding oxidoreductase [Bryobacteraceae bacterium]|nr:FAD-binding oxidoreductase [Bryobacteraceae bacterium]